MSDKFNLELKKGPHSTDMCDGLIEQKNSYLSEAFECRLPTVYRQKGSEFTYGGETFSELPLGAIKEASPFRGKCSGKNLCFRENHRWACDSGLCNGGKESSVPECEFLIRFLSCLRFIKFLTRIRTCSFDRF